jgi:hypothetical protein
VKKAKPKISGLQKALTNQQFTQLTKLKTGLNAGYYSVMLTVVSITNNLY